MDNVYFILKMVTPFSELFNWVNNLVLEIWDFNFIYDLINVAGLEFILLLTEFQVPLAKCARMR